MYPQQPQQPAYPPVPTAYPPQFPQQPAYPAQQQAPVYPPQYAPQYPPQPVYPAAPPLPPTAPGSLDAFYSQPSTGGGKAWSFHNKANGTTYSGIVSRAVTDADIQQQTDMNTGAPRAYRDGRAMFVMVVPLIVQPSPEFPDGIASWWVRGQARDELARAMAEAGAPVGPPEYGAIVHVTKVGERAGAAGRNPSYQYRVVYQRPTGAAPVAQPAAYEPVALALPIGQAPGYPPVAMEPQYAQAAQVQQPMPPMAPPPVQAAPVPMPQPAPAQTAPAPAPAPAATPPGLSEDQAALFAKLTGG